MSTSPLGGRGTAERERAALIEAASKAKEWKLRFPPDLERQFEQDTGPERTRNFVWCGFLGTVFCCLFLFNYFTMLPDVAWRALLIQVAFTAPVLFKLMIYMRTNPSPFRRELAETVAIVASLLAGMASYQGSIYPAATFFRYCPVLTFIFLNVVAGVRFRFALVASMVVVLCHIVDVQLYDGIDSDMKGLITGSVLFACGLTLMANYRIEKDARRTYLSNEREVLRRDEVARLANHDVLTGLANRSLLQRRITESLARARSANGSVAVLCIDLDGFKAVNDLRGHAAGDQLLREVAARLSRCMRETDTVARLGGDEFVVLQTDNVQPDTARILAERLIASLSEPYSLGADEVDGAVTASIGVALFPCDGENPETLLHNADTALYRAKWAGKNRAAFFRPEMDHELRERRAMEHDLHQAAARGQFTLAWQPLSSAGTESRITGFEVLLRWHHPKRGPVPPDLFIPVAESCGAITGIGAWVLNEACHEAASWSAPLRVAVNVSPIQVQQGDAFVEMVERALACSGLAPTRLTLEVTEGVLIRDTDRVLAVLNRLKALGVQIALDDFGTGYSSLATLRTFPFDKIKIDRSFLSEIGDMPHGQNMATVRAVLGLARGLGLPAVAEGVETELQLEALHAAGCEEVQGWLIGKPASIESFCHLTRTLAAASAA